MKMVLGLPQRDMLGPGYGDRSFSACAPNLWNQLPDNIWAAGSVAIFKRQLKTHLFKDVYIN